MQVRLATIEDASPISVLINRLSDPFFLTRGGEGAEMFIHSISETAIKGYVTAPNFCYQVAESEGQLVGVVALRDNSHLYHLFITPVFQGRGMGRELWQSAKEQALRAGNPGRFTVNSSLGAVPAYELFWYVAGGSTVAKHGIAFQPMMLVEDDG